MIKPQLIIAGPGAGKTYNMVQTIIGKLPSLSSSKYMVVITYTNSAADNIKTRLSRKINIPKNVYIGTIHSFLNKFIVIPYSSLNSDSVGTEKLFIQCDIDGIFDSYKKEKGKNYDFKTAAAIKAKMKIALNKKGYISFDQSIAIAKECIDNASIANILCNRIQYLFVDEFQDTNNSIFYILDKIRKVKKTELYCVGDPEQFIQSFDIVSKVFGNIPILKTSSSTQFDTLLNRNNHRCSQTIVTFLNRFNAREYSGNAFSQESKTNVEGSNVIFINQHTNATNIIPVFNSICDTLNITNGDRCIIAKKNDVVNRVAAALGNNYKTPSKSTTNSPVKAIIDVFLSSLQLTQTEFLKIHKTDILTLRKYGILMLRAIQDGTITNENTFANFITNTLGYTLKSGIPINVGMIKNLLLNDTNTEAIMISNIHNIKGLESEAVLALAKTQEELLLWIETDRAVREKYRDKEKTDYPRLGYVAFSRAKLFLSIACLEPVSIATKNKLTAIGVEIRT